MGGLIRAFGIIENALSSDQEAINVTANNVGQADTPGYTRQVTNWQENDPVTINGRQYGTGSSITSTQSQRNRILEQRIHQQTQSQSAVQARQDGLTSIETIFGQVTTGTSGANPGGLGDQLNTFWDSLNQLAATPANDSVRAGVLSAANSLAASFNQASTQLGAVTASLNQQVSVSVSQINALTQTIANLNHQIQSENPSGDAGVLEDQRQQNILQLSKLIGVNEIQTEGNGLTLATPDGSVLVSGDVAVPLSTTNVGGSQHVLSGSADITSTIHGGSLAGSLGVLTVALPNVQSALDTLAHSVATQVNAVQTTGSDETGATGGPIFAIPSTVAGSAAAISVAISDPKQIAAAAAGSGPGDNWNAQALANLANQQIVSGSTTSEYYAAFESNLGGAVQSAGVQNTALSASLAQLTSQRNSLSGVSQNDEAANLQNYERSFQAASKIFSILDTLMGSALNLGVPGVAAQ